MISKHSPEEREHPAGFGDRAPRGRERVTGHGATQSQLCALPSAGSLPGAGFV